MTEAVAKGPEEAVAESEAHINDFLFRGGADTEVEDVEVGQKLGVGELIKAAWANAKATESAWLEQAAKPKADAFFKKPEVQPRIDESKKVAETRRIIRLIRTPDGEYTAQTVEARAAEPKWKSWRRDGGYKPKAAAPEFKPHAEPKPEPQPKIEPEEEAREVVRLNLSAPYDIARTFIRLAENGEGKKRYVFIGKVEGKLVREPTLWRWKGDFKCWNGRCYEDVDDDQIRSEVYDFLDQAVALNDSAVKPELKKVNEVIDGLKAGTNLSGVDIPCWIKVEGRPQPRGLLVCRNGLLELETGKLWNHDPRFFCLNSVDFDFDPRARAPRWEQFLGEVWPGDEQAVATLQEFFGLWLTDETKYQKACALIGPPRSGKGTIGRVLKGLLGSTSYAAVSLQSLGSEFGMAHLIGKKLALVPDVKLDRRMNITVVMERLLTTIGEDEQAINRKNKPFWQGRLGIRWLVLGNDIPRFRGTDEAGALAARMIMIGMNEDFYGKEDFDLTEKLLAERAGILNWAMEGLRRLRDRGRFIQPTSGMELIQKLRASTSTMGLFVDECCVLGPNESVECDILWSAFCEWSERRELAVTLSNNTFSGALHRVFPSVGTTRPRRDNEDKRPRFFSNIRLRQGWREM